MLGILFDLAARVENQDGSLYVRSITDISKLNCRQDINEICSLKISIKPLTFRCDLLSTSASGLAAAIFIFKLLLLSYAPLKYPSPRKHTPSFLNRTTIRSKTWDMCTSGLTAAIFNCPVRFGRTVVSKLPLIIWQYLGPQYNFEDVLLDLRLYLVLK